jgi:hypothetical protein
MGVAQAHDTQILTNEKSLKVKIGQPSFGLLDYFPCFILSKSLNNFGRFILFCFLKKRAIIEVTARQRKPLQLALERLARNR